MVTTSRTKMAQPRPSVDSFIPPPPPPKNNLLLNISFLLFNFKFNMISSTHLISSPSAGHVHSFQCLWLQKRFEKKRRTFVPEHRKNHAHELVSIRRENLPTLHHLSIKSVELQSFCNFWLISFSCYFSGLELES